MKFIFENDFELMNRIYIVFVVGDKKKREFGDGLKP